MKMCHISAVPRPSNSSTPNVRFQRWYSSTGSGSPADVASRRHERSCLAAAEWLTIWLIIVDRKSTRLNSSHSQISYAVFCLKKKKRHTTPLSLFFFFNDTATTEIYTLSLHDALPIFRRAEAVQQLDAERPLPAVVQLDWERLARRRGEPQAREILPRGR